MEKHFTFVIIGGGIAGISCIESLKVWSETDNILLITPSPIVKVAKSTVNLTRYVVEVDIAETNVQNVIENNSYIQVITDFVTSLNHPNKLVLTKNNLSITFDKLCICTGARPYLIDHSNPFILGIRDTESVSEFQKRISSARKIVVVGNGGIASEIVHEVKGVEMVWVIKDDHISKTFLDPGAAEFMFSGMKKGEDEASSYLKRMKYEMSRVSSCMPNNEAPSPALGPDWHSKVQLKGISHVENITVEYCATVEEVIQCKEGEWPVKVQLSNGKSYFADFVVSATGVIPNSELFKNGNEELLLSTDGGIIVDSQMETSLKDVYAAGDVCTAGWEQAPHWHQMRLWGQARQMGMYAARCMVASLKNESVYQDFCFEIFTHATKLFGFKVILLGLFNGQKLNGDYEILLRVTKGSEYVKVVLKDGKMQGAILIGETDLEEMCENLILNQLDLTPYGEDLLNPNIDIDDYFD